MSGLGLLLLLVLTAMAVAGCTSPATATVPVTPEQAEEIARTAQWAPGQLAAHYAKHPEGYRSVEEYDRGARETIRNGRPFTYRDPTTGEPRLGFYDPQTNRFTGLTRDGRRITTHFRPDRGEAYVRELPASTYR